MSSGQTNMCMAMRTSDGGVGSSQPAQALLQPRFKVDLGNRGFPNSSIHHDQSLIRRTAAVCLPQVLAGRVHPGSTEASVLGTWSACCTNPSTRATCATGSVGLHALVNESAAWRRMALTCTSIKHRPSAGAAA